MNDPFREKLEFSHNVKCPVCGKKAEFVELGDNEYITVEHEHSQLLTEVNRRYRQFESDANNFYSITKDMLMND